MKEWLQDPTLLGMIGLGLFAVVVAGVGWCFSHSHKHTQLEEFLVEIKADLKEIRADVKTLLRREPAIVDSGSPSNCATSSDAFQRGEVVLGDLRCEA